MEAEALLPLGRQAAKFAVVGALNTALSLVFYAVLARASGGGPSAAATAFVAGAANGYAWNRRWTFGAAGSRRTRARYVTVQAGGLAATTALMWGAGRAGLARDVAYLLTLACVTSATFAANRRWTFGA